MATVTMRPCHLVVIRTNVEGGPKYTHEPISSTEGGEDAPAIKKFLTTAITQDPEEYKRANQVRGKARGIVESECIAANVFGHILPLTKKAALDAATKEAEELVAYFNATSKTCHVSLYVTTGLIAESDEKATAAMASEMRGIMEQMRAGIETADVQKIRDAANAAKQAGAALDDDTSRKVSAAVEEVREVAKQIAKKLTKKATDIAEFVQTVQLKALNEARFSFLDMDGPAEVKGEELPVVAARALDIEDDDKGSNEGGGSAPPAAMAASPSYTGPKYEV
jgi:histone H3/H4